MDYRPLWLIGQPSCTNGYHCLRCLEFSFTACSRCSHYLHSKFLRIAELTIFGNTNFKIKKFFGDILAYTPGVQHILESSIFPVLITLLLKLVKQWNCTESVFHVSNFTSLNLLILHVLWKVSINIWLIVFTNFHQWEHFGGRR